MDYKITYQRNKMTVYDCSMFLNENDLYEIRLNQHWDFVDRFIVVEAGETHTGLKKSLKFDHERFKPYAEKLTYASFDNFEEEMKKYPDLIDPDTKLDRGPAVVSEDWMRDHFQANYLFKVMTDLGAKDDDIVYISCLDEIIKKSAFEEAMTRFEDKTSTFLNGLRPVFGFHYYLYAYKFNLLHKHWRDHVAGMITEFGNLKKVLPTTFRSRGMSTHSHIPDAGWHFTFLDGTNGEMVLEKQRSWAHSRDRYDGRKLKFDHQNTFEALQRLAEDYPVQLVDITPDTHPQYIVDNLERLQNFVYRVQT